MEERWMPIEGFEGLYEVSNYGRVKSLERGVKNHSCIQIRKERILKQNFSSNSHCVVVLCKEGKTYPKLVHRLVAKAFIPNIDNKPIIDHIDTNPQNNHVSNLRWVTTQENCLNPLTRIHNSESKKGHPYHGIPLTEEARAKISKAHTGRKFTDEHRRKLSESHKKSKIAIASSMKNLEIINSKKERSINND